MSREADKSQTATEREAGQAFLRLYDITRTLRSEQGCPWDKDQTPLSLRRNLMEEAFEAIDAVSQKDLPHVREELGDVFFNVILLAYLYEQAGDFTLADVLDDVSDKLIRRHPHVFPQSAGKAEMTEAVADSKAVIRQWDRIKDTVEGRAGDSVLDSVPQGFPPLLKAYKLIAKAEKKNFKWQSADQAYKKLQEEVAEMQEAVLQLAALRQEPQASGGRKGTRSNGTASSPASEQPKAFTVSGGSPALDQAQLHLEDEIGDVLFTFVNYARHLGVDSALALEHANRKFYRRFTHVEKRMAENKIPMDGKHVDEERRFWQEAKQMELNPPGK